jgi:GNAT superfamily N-acetyltransferase
VSEARCVTVRDVRPDDAAALAQLSRVLAAHVADPDPGGATSLLSEMCFGPRPWIEIVLAEREGMLHTRERTLWLADLVVTENARGQGIGSLLLQALCRRARDLGCSAIVAELWVGNASARSFYDRIGARTNADIEIRVIDMPRR